MTEKIHLKRHRIEEALVHRGKTIEWLATKLKKRSGVVGGSRQTFYNYLNDGFDYDCAVSVADALGVRVEWLQSGISSDALVTHESHEKYPPSSPEHP